MFAKHFRLTLGRQKLLGDRYASPSLSLIVAKNDLNQNRYACLVTKKIDKRAVVRNRIRRIVLSHLQELHDRLTSGVDIFFLAKKTEATPEQLRTDVDTLLHDAHLV